MRKGSKTTAEPSKPFSCPMAAKVGALGCLLNKIKHDSCKECRGVDGFAGELATVQAELAKIGLEVEPVTKQVAGLVIPMELDRIRELESRGVHAEQAGELLELFLAGEIGKIVKTECPFKRSYATMQAGGTDEREA